MTGSQFAARASQLFKAACNKLPIPTRFKPKPLEPKPKPTVPPKTKQSKKILRYTKDHTAKLKAFLHDYKTNTEEIIKEEARKLSNRNVINPETIATMLDTDYNVTSSFLKSSEQKQLKAAKSKLTALIQAFILAQPNFVAASNALSVQQFALCIEYIYTTYLQMMQVKTASKEGMSGDDSATLTIALFSFCCEQETDSKKYLEQMSLLWEYLNAAMTEPQFATIFDGSNIVDGEPGYVVTTIFTMLSHIQQKDTSNTSKKELPYHESLQYDCYCFIANLILNETLKEEAYTGAVIINYLSSLLKAIHEAEDIDSKVRPAFIRAFHAAILNQLFICVNKATSAEIKQLHHELKKILTYMSERVDSSTSKHTIDIVNSLIARKLPPLYLKKVIFSWMESVSLMALPPHWKIEKKVTQPPKVSRLAEATAKEKLAKILNANKDSLQFLVNESKTNPKIKEIFQEIEMAKKYCQSDDYLCGYSLLAATYISDNLATLNMLKIESTSIAFKELVKSITVCDLALQNNSPRLIV